MLAVVLPAILGALRTVLSGRMVLGGMNESNRDGEDEDMCFDGQDEDMCFDGKDEDLCFDRKELERSHEAGGKSSKSHLLIDLIHMDPIHTDIRSN